MCSDAGHIIVRAPQSTDSATSLLGALLSMHPDVWPGTDGRWRHCQRRLSVRPAACSSCLLCQGNDTASSTVTPPFTLRLKHSTCCMNGLYVRHSLDVEHSTCCMNGLSVWHSLDVEHSTCCMNGLYVRHLLDVEHSTCCMNGLSVWHSLDVQHSTCCMNGLCVRHFMWNSVFSQRSVCVQETAFRKVVQATMIRDRQHGPVIEINRIQVSVILSVVSDWDQPHTGECHLESRLSQNCWYIGAAKYQHGPVIRLSGHDSECIGTAIQYYRMQSVWSAWFVRLNSVSSIYSSLYWHQQWPAFAIRYFHLQPSLWVHVVQ